MAKKSLVTWHDHTVTRPRGCVVWFTGLSGSGKSTIANCVDAKLHARHVRGFVLDGDNIRHGLSASPAILEPVHGPEFAQRFGLTFAAQDREENIRRIGCVAEMFCAAGLIALAAFVSPYRRDRELIRSAVTRTGNPEDFVEVFVDTPIEICEARDPKGLYRKARAGEISGFTGVNDPYEAPTQPELHLSGEESIDSLADRVINHLKSIGKLDSILSS